MFTAVTEFIIHGDVSVEETYVPSGITATRSEDRLGYEGHRP